MLETIKPREQDGRDSFSRFRAQVRAAAIASLSILEGDKVDRIYCDLHDDYVIRKKDGKSYKYQFVQVKTKSKQNHNWTVNELFGLKTTIRDQTKQSTKKIKESFIGKLLLHTAVFGDSCYSVVFQTNINNDDNVEKIAADISNKDYLNKYLVVIIDRFNECFSKDCLNLSEDKIKSNICKLSFETDVQFLKNGADNFEPLVKTIIYKFSEIDLTHIESREIIMNLLDLVENKSSGVIDKLSKTSIEKEAGISITDLLDVLSISKDAYEILLKSGDSEAIKNASIIQRTLIASGAGEDEVEYCSRCKTEWDLWLRKNRHILSELDLNTLTSKIKKLLSLSISIGNMLSLSTLRQPLKELLSELKSEKLAYDLSENLLLGGVFSELVKGKT